MSWSNTNHVIATELSPVSSSLSCLGIGVKLQKGGGPQGTQVLAPAPGTLLQLAPVAVWLAWSALLFGCSALHSGEECIRCPMLPWLRAGCGAGLAHSRGGEVEAARGGVLMQPHTCQARYASDAEGCTRVQKGARGCRRVHKGARGLSLTHRPGLRVASAGGHRRPWALCRPCTGPHPSTCTWPRTGPDT